MSKKPNGNGHAKAAPPSPPAPPLSEDEALAIANGAAISAFDFLVARRAADTDTLPAGRFWYTGGEVVDDPVRIAQDLVTLKEFLLEHPGVPPAAAYLYVTRDLRRQRPSPWALLPLPMRQAYAVFASVLPLLILEARREAKAKTDAETPAPSAPPNRGIFKRIDKRVSNKATRVHMVQGQKGHVAR